jgi:hypothetical protein
LILLNRNKKLDKLEHIKQISIYEILIAYKRKTKVYKGIGAKQLKTEIKIPIKIIKKEKAKEIDAI